jgi:hypothetical protein
VESWEWAIAAGLLRLTEDRDDDTGNEHQERQGSGHKMYLDQSLVPIEIDPSRDDRIQTPGVREPRGWFKCATIELSFAKSSCS